MIYEQFNLSRNNPIIRNHTVYGQELLPGLAYIDLIYQIFRKHQYSYSGLELCNMTIFNPLFVKPDGIVRLGIQCVEVRQGQWQIRVEGQPQDAHAEEEKILYATAEIHQTGPVVFDETLDTAQIKESAKKIIPLHKIYEQCRHRELVHTGVMKAEGSLYEGDTAILADISLGRDSASAQEGFMFHPALIDSCGIGVERLLASRSQGEEELLLPLFYESFRASALLQKNCVARIQTVSLQRTKELLHMTLEFFDASGNKIAELKNLVGKLVRDAETLLPGRKETQPSAEEAKGESPLAKPPEIPVCDAGNTGSGLLAGASTFLQGLLSERLGKLAGHIDTTMGFYEMGLDSRGLLEMVKAVSTKINANLPPTLLFEYTTIDELAGYLTEKYPAKFEQDVPVTEEREQSAFVQADRPADTTVEAAGEVHISAMSARDEDIAIIGMAGRYPKAADLREFWANLKEGKDCISEIPVSRWEWQQLEGIKSPSGKNISRWGGFIDNPDYFDPHFFRISPREAETVDPQERLFLEICWEAIEDAGYTPRTLVAPQGRSMRRLAGVFVGVMHKDYTLLGAEALSQGQAFPLSLSNAPIANRVSYFCNFHGPSLAIDTLCSSSLTAVHFAMESIKRGECEVALAGGVNLSLHPGKYATYGMADMHSSDGYCHTFGRGGDGYVSAEGVGAVVLKPLRKALQDGDHVYAIIKSSMVSHGGTVSGITVPSPVAQGNLIAECLEKTGIDPRTISYVEAHGTGTSLGDPIEMEGLVKAFRQYTQNRQFCSIGSVKSNIGHAESAAGICGLHKVALQLYYKMLVPSLHAEELNPYIDFAQSPFYVQQQLEAWDQPGVMENGQRTVFPRRAGLSSFGAAGSNVHIILEEYPHGEMRQTLAVQAEGAGPVIVPLSAKNKERLQAYASKLLEYLKELPGEENFAEDERMHLTNLAYTFQVGREAMEERAVFIVRNREELMQKLEAFLENKEEIENCCQGQVKQYKNVASLFLTDEDSKELVHKWIVKRKIQKLAELWAKGLEIQWDLLYGEVKPRRISLPTYAFARERYWVPTFKDRAANTASGAALLAPIHPLLHKNTSDLSEQRFSSTFTGKEFFLSDHVVQGQRVLPGVVYLEMARAAVEQALGSLKQENERVCLKNIAWIRPVAVGSQPVQVHIRLLPEDSGEIAYEIYSLPEEATGEPVVHSKGSAVLCTAEDIPELDIRLLQEQCSGEELSAAQCYEIFRGMGIDYGPGHQGLIQAYVGPGQVLARLSIPSGVLNTLGQFVLHPSVMDSALQASIGYKAQAGITSAKPSLPFALQELDIFGACTPVMWAVVAYSDNSAARDKTQNLDIHLCDDQGKLCARMKGFSMRVLEGGIQIGDVSRPALSGIPAGASAETVRLLPVWDRVLPEKGPQFPSRGDKVLVIGGSKDHWEKLQRLYPGACALKLEPTDSVDAITEKVKGHDPVEHIVWIAPQAVIKALTDEALVEEQKQGVLLAFKLVKALLRLRYGAANLGWTVLTTMSQLVNAKEPVNTAHASLHGLMGSMAKEYPHWKIRLIDMESGCDWPFDDIFTLPADRRGRAWAYRNKEWYKQQLIPFEAPPAGETLYKKGGVYVVLGGAGDIGEAWSEYMIRTYQAQIIWIGRRQADKSIRSKVERLAAMGPAPLYIAADAASLKDLRHAYKEIKKRFPHIHGVIHSAMVLTEHSLEDMEEQQFAAGLSAKVDVSVRMAQVFDKEPLDFVLFFSSMIAFIKNPKQSHYASGCAFKDAFAHRLSLEWPCTVRVMNWGYWGSAKAAASVELQQLTQIGLEVIDPVEGIQALEQLLTGPVQQMALMKAAKSLAVEGMNTGERIAVYPESIPTAIQSIQGAMQGRDAKKRHARPEDGPQKEMDALLCKLLWGQLQAMGLCREKDIRLDSFKITSGLRNLYGRWMDESAAILARNGYLCCEGECCTAVDAAIIDMTALWKEWDKKKGTWLKNPNTKAQAILVEATLRALPDILTGKRMATDIMFPDSSMKLVEGIYKNNAQADYFNEALADTMATYIEGRLALDPQAQIRIIEIGAGTGGTSARVFQRLKPYREHIEEYCYTDISKAFLLYAEKEYGADNPYLAYKIFNVEAPPDGQGVDLGGYDIAIAANALHATKNIRQTLRNTKAVLKKNGLLLLNEMSGNGMFTHLTFGLLEGWWLYEDTALRIPGCPGLYPIAWQAVLEEEGFRSVFFPAQADHDLNQQIVAAESDGMIRKKQTAAQPTAPVKHSQPVTGSGAKENAGIPQKAAAQAAYTIVQKPVHKTAVTDTMVEDYIKEIITEKLSEALKVQRDEIEMDEPFADYGLDSIIGVHVVQVINKTLKIELETTSLFDYSSVNLLAAYILSKYKDTIAKALGQTEIQAEVPERPRDAAVEMSAIPKIKETAPIYSNQKRFMGRGVPVEAAMERQESGSGKVVKQDAIAIIGMSGRYAKSNTLQELWEHLSRGTELIEKASRWDLSKYYSKDAKYCDVGGFVDDIDKFDPFFFNISGLEAAYMDPQQRIFLEEAWKGLEDAGYAGKELQGRRCGVYVGCNGGGDYSELFGDNIPAQSFWGVASSIIPARIAYCLDLQGPAIAIDTACSSSLVAIHLACQGLWGGETELAIAGGIFIQSTPWFYLNTNRAGMLSHTGHSYTFDERADGFIPGEGVGVVVLKRLNDAIADGDHIYGVIRGSGMNQDGTTNGITAPSANSQERLESYVYDTFDINPEQIQVVEAHGTGTKLGDPIEYGALTRAFRKYTDKKQYCAIGSIKTNIGHAAHAAGVAGITKILLSMQHKQIPPSLCFQSGNPNIQFDDSPFFVNTDLKAWNPGPREKRCAAVSSFGFSGTNVHMVIEEAPELVRVHQERPGYLIVLSARTPEQLRQQAEQLVERCGREASIDCGNVSYTLLTGRRHCSHRLACIVRDTEELSRLLEKWLEKNKVSQVYVSELHENDRREQSFMKQLGNECIRNCYRNALQTSEYLEQLSMAAELYVQGYELEYKELFSGDGYCRIPLPTYPFAKERCWVPEERQEAAGSDRQALAEQAAFIHPLLHQNTSNFTEHRFTSTFTGQEPFLYDHIVKGQRVLPGVAYLEMVRVAVEQAAGPLEEGQAAIRLKDVAWVRPVIAGSQTVQVHTGLSLREDGEITWEIYSEPIEENAEPVVHCYGTAELELVTTAPALDIEALQARCGKNIISSRRCYEIFTGMGVNYGPGYQCVEAMYAGEDEVLAKLSLPAAIQDTLDAFVLHPGLMDSAIQASIALMLDPDGTAPLKLGLAFALEEIKIIGRCTADMWASVTRCQGSNAGNRIQKLDIDVCDGQGKICVRMKGFSTRAVEGETQAAGLLAPGCNSGGLLVGNVLLTPVWDVIAVERGQMYPSPAEKVLVIGGTECHKGILRQYYPEAVFLENQVSDGMGDIAKKLEAQDSIQHIIWIAPYTDLKSVADSAWIEEQDKGVLQIFRIMKALLSLGYGSRELGWTVVTLQAQPISGSDTVNPAHASIHGFIGSMTKEYPNWTIRLVDLEADGGEELDSIFNLPADPEGNPLVYRGKEWYRQRLLPVKGAPKQKPYRKGGIYVVIGGAGGIGEVWSEYMIRTYQAQIIWIGRRQADESIRAQITRLGDMGPRPHYIAADAADLKALRQAYKEIKKQYPRIHGVIHSAVGTLDQSLANMEEEHFRAGLSAKIDISVCMAQVFEKEALDFVVFFSSIGAFAKDHGKSSYASGCTFMDAFAHRISREWTCAVKVMNWGYWGDIGVGSAVPPVFKKRLAQAGIGAITPPEAMEALELLISGGVDQLALIKAEKPLTMEGLQEGEAVTLYPEKIELQIRELQSYIPCARKLESTHAAAGTGTSSLPEKVQAILLQTVAEILHVKAADIDADAEVEDYGLDLVKRSEVANRLNQEWNLGLTGYMFSDYPTIHALAADLAQEYQEMFAKQFPDEKPEGDPQEELDTLLCRLLWGQLRSMGCFNEKNTRLDSLKTNFGLQDLYGRWMDESIAVLEREQYLCYEEDFCTVAEPAAVDMAALWKQWDRKKGAWLQDQDRKAQTVLVEETLRALPDILTGKRMTTDIMFPNSSMELVEGIYKNNAQADYFNEVLADTMVAYIDERLAQKPQAQIRIIEIGAGTGGTSERVFQRLKPYRENIGEYCYTDISRAFLLHAEKEYGADNPYLAYKIFNVETPVAEQDVSMDSYDIVIATNVLHATKNIRQTLRNVKALLKKNGLLLLNEMSKNSLFTHLTFGLLEGWWLYEDTALRIPGCPALYPEVWQAVLEREGFAPVLFPAQQAHALGQQIIAAGSDGVVRQKQVAAISETFVKQPVKIEVSVKKPLAQMPPMQKPFVQTPLAVQKGEIREDILKEKSVAYIKKLVGETLRIPSHKIDASEPLEAYGIDSILVHQMTNALRKVFDNISSTLFFEYQTINGLVQHFIQTEKDVLVRLLGLEVQSEAPQGAQKQDIPGDNTPAQPLPIGAQPAYRRPKCFLQQYVPETGRVIEQTQWEPIAIIGMSGLYPQARTLEELWKNLEEGRDCITEIPEERWLVQSFYHPDPQEALQQGKSYSKWGGFIDEFADFDPLFFNISPRDALSMDPQERLFIMSCWKGLEDAGYTRKRIAEKHHGNVGVFVGITKTGFNLYGPDLWNQGERLFPYTSFGSVANRVSYLLNLRGPSIPIDTMCSSSLTAVHEACEHLHRGECEMALAGGVNLFLHPSSYSFLCTQRMLSNDGKCKSFGKGANGFVPGEGVGVILLKPLSRALADEDHIYAVIRGSSINHGGKTNGYTVPNPAAQGEVIWAALDKAGVNARTISYIEAHGTGTELGDPIEITGLTQAFEKDTQDKGFCAVGSIKSNMGHLESAAGIVGITKIVLQMQHKKIAPSLHAKELNPNIDFEKTPFIVPQELMEWKRPVVTLQGETREYPRMAGVSSFGAGGANAHIILEEFIPEESSRGDIPTDSPSPVIIVLSAKNEDRLKDQAQQLLTAIRQKKLSDRHLMDMAYTLQVGREAMEERMGLLVKTMQELEAKLKDFVEAKEGIEDLYRGYIKSNKETIAVLVEDEDLQMSIDAWVAKGKYAKLLNLWVKGLAFDWDKLYSGSKPKRISLPGYPFARERYWPLEGKKHIPAVPAPFQNHERFDDAFYDQLIDEVINDAISIDSAVTKTQKLNHYKMGGPGVRREK